MRQHRRPVQLLDHRTMLGRIAATVQWSVPGNCAGQVVVAALAALVLAAPHSLAQHSLPAAKLESIVTAQKIRLSEAGIRIVSVRSGKTLFDSFGDKLFVPASNAKLVTTAAALHLLGREHRFQTRLYTRGAIEGKTLEGDLVVVGGGDPDISGRNHGGDPCFLFKQWAAKLRQLGIRRVRGRLIGDASAFDAQYVHPSWPKDQLEKWYCAPVSALALNDNCLDATVKAGPQVGEPPQVTIMPSTGYAGIDNRCVITADKTRHLYGFLGRAGAGRLVLRGRFWSGGYPATTSIPVEDPSLFFLNVMKETLESCGVAVSGGLEVAHEAVDLGKDATLVATYESPLTAAVRVAGKRSQNFYAEQVFKTLGRGSFAGGADVVEKFLAKVSPAAAGCRMVDGSGMSRDNRLSAAAIVDVLRWMTQQPESDVFAASLPIAGFDGTLKRRLTAKEHRGRVRAKTGTLAGACALSGYIETDADTLAFSILINSRRAGLRRMRAAQDNLCRHVLDLAGRRHTANSIGPD
jgi:D-alanyl-D-alanine carboxypeptidase/D-alanyl-D-alanine-endopeptidase (penicillin-binding protein 4)